MKSRFEGSIGKRLLIDLLKDQVLVAGNEELANELAAVGELVEVPEETTIIEQGGIDNDVYFVVSGQCSTLVHGRRVATRGPGTHIGEMAAIQPSQKRSATIKSIQPTVLLRISESQFVSLGAKFPNIWRLVAKELARRLEQRNAFVATTHDKIRIFIISSTEALEVARAIQDAFAADPYLVVVWTDGVFRASTYALESLEREVDVSDFAIAVAQGDDQTISRGEQWPTTRDNVVFELGFFMGRLGRARSILVEPRGEEVKLPSDLTGLTTLSYRWSGDRKELPAAIAPVCNKIRGIVRDMGPNN